MSCFRNRRRAWRGLAQEARQPGVVGGLNGACSSSSGGARYVVRACSEDTRAGASSALAVKQEPW